VFEEIQLVVKSSSYRAEIDAVGAPEWSELLDRFQDANIYQTRSYGTNRWGENNLSHLILRRDGEVVGMAQLRIIPFRFFQSGIAYLRWGPLCQLRGTELDLETCRKMAAALHEEYVQKRGLFLRILPNACAGSPRANIFQIAFSQFVNGPLNQTNLERTFLLDLTPPLEDLRRRLDQKWRNQLNRAERNGLKVIDGDGMELYKSFVDMYREMWARKRFEEGVNVDEFARIQEALPKAQRMKVLICMQGNTPVAGIVCSAMGNSAIYLLGATSDNGLKAKGAYLLQWKMIEWLKRSGIQYYDLGGINPERNPGVYHFKQGFSGRDVSRIAPLESCGNFFSLVCMKTADFVRDGRESLRGLRNGSVRLLTRRKS